MKDEIYDRTYQHGRDQLNQDLGRAFDRLGGAIGNAFKVLNRLEYSAPWNRHDKPAA